MRDFLLGAADDEVFGAFRPGTSGVFESAGESRSEAEMDALILEAAETQLRSEAMGAVLTWVDDGDWSFDALDSLLEGLAADESDDEEEMDDDEAEHYEALLDAAADALEALGGDSANVDAALAGDDDAARKLGQHLANRLDNVTKSDDDLVSEFSVGGEMVVESTRRVVRNGETRRVPRRRRRKRRMTAAQRAALKKARRRANSSSARRSRKRSMRRRRQMGL